MPDNSACDELLVGLIGNEVIVNNGVVDKSVSACSLGKKENCIVGGVASEVDLGVGDRRVEVTVALESNFLVSSGLSKLVTEYSV